MTSSVDAAHRGPIEGTEGAGSVWQRLATGSPTSRTRWPLAALCAGTNVLEAILVLSILPATDPTLAPQASAVAPFGVFHDLRWLSVYDTSWAVLVPEVAGLLLVRGALTALSVRWAWPADREAPSLRTLLARGVGATALFAVLLTPSTTLLFAVGVVPVSWLFIAAVPLAFAVALIVYPASVRAGWWRRPIPLAGIGWMTATFAVVSVGASAVVYAPRWSALAIVAVIGLFNARAWVGLVAAVVLRPAPTRAVPVAPVALVVLAAGVAAGSVLGFVDAHHGEPAATGPPASPAAPGEEALLIVDGYGSTWNGSPAHPIPGPYYEQRFSYRGLGATGTPLAYTSADTVKPLAQLDDALAVQVAALHRATGRDVDLVAESEGALVAKTYLLTHPTAAVRVLAVASPLQGPGRVSYPTGDTGGTGMVSRDAMQVLSDAFRSVAPIDLSPSSSFLRSLNTAAPSLRDVLSCPAPGVMQFAVLPLADATTAPAQLDLPFPSVVVPGFHGGLLQDPSVQRTIADVLDGRLPPDRSMWSSTNHALASASSAWQVPTLPVSAYPGASGRAPGASCPAEPGRPQSLASGH